MKRLLLILATLGALLAGCGAPSATTTAPAAEIDLAALPAEVDAATVAALTSNPAVFVLDVREPSEYAEGHIPGVTLIPLGTLGERLDEIPTDRPVIVTCRSGNRSGQAVEFLRQQGYDNVHNMAGGILAWQAAGLPVEK